VREASRRRRRRLKSAMRKQLLEDCERRVGRARCGLDDERADVVLSPVRSPRTASEEDDGSPKARPGASGHRIKTAAA
jgi:hypothetical protein